MAENMIPLILGILIIILGICNMRGNLSSLHWYHRQRVSEEDRIPFGKMIGLGTVIIGISIVLYSFLSLTGEFLHLPVLLAIGSVIMAVGAAIGLVLSIFAMIKYNKGIF